MFNCGMMAVELPGPVIDRLFKDFAGRDTHVETDLEKNVFTFSADGRKEDISFAISDFDRALVAAGGWVDYADANY